MKFCEFSTPDPLKQLFPNSYKEKTWRIIFAVMSAAFLQKYRIFKEHGDWLHASQSLPTSQSIMLLLLTKFDAHDHTYKNSLSKFKIPQVFQN